MDLHREPGINRRHRVVQNQHGTTNAAIHGHQSIRIERITRIRGEWFVGFAVEGLCRGRPLEGPARVRSVGNGPLQAPLRTIGYLQRNINGVIGQQFVGVHSHDVPIDNSVCRSDHRHLRTNRGKHCLGPIGCAISCDVDLDSETVGAIGHRLVPDHHRVKPQRHVLPVGVSADLHAEHLARYQRQTLGVGVGCPGGYQLRL